MQNLQVFNFQEKQVRTENKNGETWFVAKDICDILDHSNSRMATQSLNDNEKGVSIVDTLGGKQEVQVINESGLYALIFSSRKPEAKQFREWVTGEVLPSIRKTGGYQLPTTYKDALKQLIIEIEAKEEAQATVNILTHVQKTYTTTEIAKELNLKSATALNKILKDKHIQYKQNNTWVLYSKYADLAYTQTKQMVLENGTIIYDTRWTQRGREFILKNI